MTMPEALPLLLLAGAPGAGKSTVASHLHDSLVISMDDFYLGIDDSRLPHRNSLPVWDSRRSVELDVLQEAVERLLRGEEASIPRYDMRESRADGFRRVTPQGMHAIVVEGVYVFDLQPAGVSRLTRVLLTCPLPRIVWRRLTRDLREGRYPLSRAPLQTLQLLNHYRRYNAIESRRADHVLPGMGSCRRLADEISSRVGYWNC